jgi:hypothetical protein
VCEIFGKYSLEELELEILNFQEDISLKSSFSDSSVQRHFIYIKLHFELKTDIFMCPNRQLCKESMFRDKTPCSPLNVNRRFGGTRPLHLQGRRI